MSAIVRTYTVCADQPAFDQWEVEGRTFTDRDAAVRYMRRTYTAAELRGEDDRCIPFLRCDLTGDRSDNPRL